MLLWELSTGIKTLLWYFCLIKHRWWWCFCLSWVHCWQVIGVNWNYSVNQCFSIIFSHDPSPPHQIVVCAPLFQKLCRKQCILLPSHWQIFDMTFVKITVTVWNAIKTATMHGKQWTKLKMAPSMEDHASECELTVNEGAEIEKRTQCVNILAPTDTWIILSK